MTSTENGIEAATQQGVAQPTQEQHQHQAGDQSAEDCVANQALERLANVLSLVPEDRHLECAEQGVFRNDLFNHSLELLANFEGVRRGLLLDAHADRKLAGLL